MQLPLGLMVREKSGDAPRPAFLRERGLQIQEWVVNNDQYTKQSTAKKGE
jgi:hypothetical protein